MWLGYTKSDSTGATFQDINGTTNFLNWAPDYPDLNSSNTVVYTNVWNNKESWKNVSPDGVKKCTHIVCQFRPGEFHICLMYDKISICISILFTSICRKAKFTNNVK